MFYDARARALTRAGERYLQRSLVKVVGDRAPVAAPQDQQKQPKLDPPKMEVLVVQPDGRLNCPRFPEGQDMLPVLPTPDVLKELEALNVQYPELAE